MHESTRRIAVGITVGAVLVVVGITGCGAPQDQGPASMNQIESVDDPIVRGQMIYSTYCQGCHGATGLGDGPVAPMLSTPLPDLTRLVALYGEYPEELVRNTIDGRAQVEGHGTREMPVWGNIWNDPDDPVAEERIAHQIADLVAFIESIQVLDEPAADG